MHVIVRTVDGKTHEVEIDENASLFDFKVSFANLVDKNVSEIKLVSNGALLVDTSQKMVDVCKDKDTLVALTIRPLSSIADTNPRPDLKDIKASRSLVRKYIGMMFGGNAGSFNLWSSGESSAKVEGSDRLSREQRLAARWDRQRRIGPPVMRSARMPRSSSGEEVPNAQPDNPIEVSQESIAHLIDMGFTELAARNSLILNGMNIHAAAEWLLTHANSALLLEPLPPELIRAVRPSGQSSIESMLRQAQTLGAQLGVQVSLQPSADGTAVSVQPAGGEDHEEEEYEPSEEDISSLIDMGFERETVIQALRISHGDQQGAVSFILRDRSVEAISSEDVENLEHAPQRAGETAVPAAPPAGVNVLTGMLPEGHPLIQTVLSNPTIAAGLSNPRVLAALTDLLEHPSAAGAYMSDPEIGPVLLQLHGAVNAGRIIEDEDEDIESAL